MEAACALPWLEEVILDFLEVHGLRAACAAVRAAGKRLVVRAAAILPLTLLRMLVAGRERVTYVAAAPRLPSAPFLRCTVTSCCWGKG